MPTVLITGATGFIGSPLCERLAMAGWKLRATSREPDRARRRLPAGAEAMALPRSPKEWADAVAGCDAVVNLAGESIAGGRWTDERKQRILSSRVDVTRALAGAIGTALTKPAVLVSASAVGFYGPHGDEPLDESSPPGDDFLARACVAWEREAQNAEADGVRVVRLRLGVVLGEGGGALEKMLPPFKMFVGGPLGSGSQWMSWVHRDDVIGLIDFALSRAEVRGAVNATAPDPRTMADFSRALGEVLGRPSWARVPAVVLRLALGEMADMLLTGQRVLPVAAQRAGYVFRYAKLEEALRASV